MGPSLGPLVPGAHETIGLVYDITNTKPDAVVVEGEAKIMLERFYGRLRNLTWFPMSYVIHDWWYNFGTIHIGSYDFFTTGQPRTLNYDWLDHFDVLNAATAW